MRQFGQGSPYLRIDGILVDPVTKAVHNLFFPTPEGTADTNHAYLPGAQTPVLGPELVVNGDFSNGTTGWSTGGNWVISGGAISTTNQAYNRVFYQTESPTQSGRSYVVEYTITSLLLGSVCAYLGGVRGVRRTSAGTYRETIVMGASNAFVGCITDDAVATTVSIDNISVREILSYNDVIQGFHTGNYVESTGVTPATVDQPVGLVLDAAGSVGANIAPPIDSTWNTNDAAWAAVGNTAVATNCPASKSFFKTLSGFAAGKMYRYEITISGYSQGSIFISIGGASASTTHSANGTFSGVIITSAVNQNINIATAGASTTLTVTSFSVKEITGIHASQSTSGFRPVERRGIVNLLLNNQGDVSTYTYTNVTNASESISGYSKSIQIPSGASLATAYKANTLTSGATYTIAIVVQMDDNSAPIFGGNVSVGDLSFQVNNTLTPVDSVTHLGNNIYLAVRSFVSNAYTGSGLIRYATQSGKGFRATSYGLFQGTLTASQILAMGGIPLTTTAAASSSAGPYYLEHKEANSHHLKLSSVPFQMADDFVVVFAGTVDSFYALRGLCGAYSSSTNNPRIQIYAAMTSGSLLAQLRDDAGNTAIPTSLGPIVLGVPFVATLVKRGGLAFTRFNAVQSASASTAGLGVTTLDTFSIGDTKGSYHSGNTNVCLPLKGTFTDAEITLLENQAAAIAGGRLVGGNFVSNI